MRLSAILVFGLLMSINSLACEKVYDASTQKSYYLKSEVIPFWNVDGRSVTNFFITNSSSTDLDVKLDLLDFSGNTYSNAQPQGTNFSNGNNPVNNWAVLISKRLGWVRLPQTSSNINGHATISWKSNECIKEPLRVTTWQGFTNNGTAFILSTVKI